MEARNETRWAKLIALLEPFHEQALATARRLSRSFAEGDDLYQEAVLRAYDKLHTLREESRFRSWFYAVLLNRHRSRQRRSFWRRFLPWEEAFPEGREPADPAAETRGRQIHEARRVALALATLPAVQREAVVLFDVEGHSIESVASLQGASVSAVKSRLARGRSKLKRWYQRHGHSGGRIASSEPAQDPTARPARGIEAMAIAERASIPAKETSHD